MRISEAQFTIFDVETTGLFPYSGDRICEIAALRIDTSFALPQKFWSLVNPMRPISYGAFSVNRITPAMLAGKPTIDKVLPSFMDFASGSVLVAYNAGFDLGFLESALGEGKDILKDYHVIDALALARKIFRDSPRYSLGVISRHLGIETPLEHRAMADALLTLKVFQKELDVIMREGIELIEDISFARSRGQKANTRVKLIEDAIREQGHINVVG
ncbi:MAG: 3'-5' exonuclease [Candidatus Omnitrophica bacterium]|nr:3'-5' exonuclease [Candidatus Omnitrophota bacterium]